MTMYLLYKDRLVTGILTRMPSNLPDNYSIERDSSLPPLLCIHRAVYGAEWLTMMTSNQEREV